MPSYLKVFAAFAVYAAIHSALLTRTARSALEGALGGQRFRGWFRAAYTAQAVLLFAAFGAYAAILPDTVLLQLGAAWAVLIWCLRLAALALILKCVADFGAFRFLGITQLRAWQRGELLDGDAVETGELVVTGFYRWVRHPMYSGALVFLWAEPRWTANGLAFTVAASLYLWIGSRHEERRLRAHYGQAYREYARRTPRFVPRFGRGRP